MAGALRLDRHVWVVGCMRCQGSVEGKQVTHEQMEIRRLGT